MNRFRVALCRFVGRVDIDSNCDLSTYVVESSGVFDTRDHLFMQVGTLGETWRGRAFELFYASRESA